MHALRRAPSIQIEIEGARRIVRHRPRSRIEVKPRARRTKVVSPMAGERKCIADVNVGNLQPARIRLKIGRESRKIDRFCDPGIEHKRGSRNGTRERMKIVPASRQDQVRIPLPGRDFPTTAEIEIDPRIHQIALPVDRTAPPGEIDQEILHLHRRPADRNRPRFHARSNAETSPFPTETSTGRTITWPFCVATSILPLIP